MTQRKGYLAKYVLSLREWVYNWSFALCLQRDTFNSLKWTQLINRSEWLFPLGKCLMKSFPLFIFIYIFIVFFHYHLPPLILPLAHSHHTDVHVHEFFFSFCSVPPIPTLTPHPYLSSSSLSMSLSLFCLLVQFVH